MDREKLKKNVEGAVTGKVPGLEPRWSASGDDLCLEVPVENLMDVARALKEDPQTYFDLLILLTGIDRMPETPRFEVVYHFRSLKHRTLLVVKTRVGEDSPEIPSLSGIWRTADWYEREAYDLLGIVFQGHPDLRRILMPEDWDGYPLRKDYPLEGNG
jgi:NADH-quinone oxidoreductase subunit C